MFPIGLVIMMADFGKPYLWTTTVFLGLQAFILLLALIRLADLKSSIIIFSIIFLLSYLVEFWGLNLGIPFGYYSYSNILQPLIKGVPLAICFAWFSVTAASLLLSRLFTAGKNPLIIAFFSAILILAFDIMLEPFASYSNGFWMWNSPSVPIQNYVSWFVIGFLFSLIIDRYVKWNNVKTGIKELYLPAVIIIIINFLNFSVVDIAGGYTLSAAAGLVILYLELSFIKKFQKNED